MKTNSVGEDVKITVPSVVCAPAAAPPGRPAKAKMVMFGMMAVVAVAGGSYWLHGLGHESTDDAFVEGHVVSVSARAASQVAKVLVQENQLVHVGDPLVELDATEAEARVAAATADLAAAEAQLAITTRNVEANLRQAKGALTQATSGLGASKALLSQTKADVEAARSRVSLAAVELERSRALRRDGVVSASDLDARQSAHDQAKASLALAEARLRSAATGIDGSAGGIELAEGRLASADTGTPQIQAAKAKVDQAIAAKHLAEVGLSYTRILAPVTGVVSRRTVEVGQVVAPGTPMLALVALDDVWIVANFKEDQLAGMAAGQEALVRVDGLGHQELLAHVEGVASATGAKFALLPPDNATGNFVKVVQRIPVLIRIDDAAGRQALKLGMSVSVTVTVKPARS